MPPNKRTISPADLAELYATKSATEIADLLGVGKSTVCNWLRADGVERRKYSPFTENKIECPYSADKLRELYWVQGLSLAEVASAAAELLSVSSLTNAVVTRWLREAGLQVRTPEQGQRVRAITHYDDMVEHAKTHLAGTDHRTKTPPTKRHIKKIQRAAAQKKRATGWETRQCAWCGKDITRRKCEFRCAPEHTFCCSSHANLDRWARKKGGFDE